MDATGILKKHEVRRRLEEGKNLDNPSTSEQKEAEVPQGGWGSRKGKKGSGQEKGQKA